MALSIDDLAFAWTWNRDTLMRLVGDVPDQQMATQPHPNLNHPAWTVLHLCAYHPVLTAMLEGETFANPWDAPCGKNSEPLAMRAQYPPKHEILRTFEDGHNAVDAALHVADPAVFDRPIPHDVWGKNFGTIGRATLFLVTSHASYHIGQLSGWRRAMGLPRI